ncbi:hypothetical protein [Clostridium perfringens]|uniref:hypothetical protein n=1 Tax=Clostridium perfringens TaxID=1502 RepID=UPI0039EC9E2D
MKNLLKKFALMLCFCIGTILINPVIEAKAMVNEDTTNEVILYEDTEKTVIAIVNDNQKDSYINDILTNPEFKQEELNKTNLNLRLPAGQIMSQKFMYKSDIQRTVDKYAGYGTFAKALSNPVTDATVAYLLKKAKFSNPWTFAATVLTWSIGDLMNRQQSWWNESLLQILQNKIRCVRVTHIRNTTSNYPAAYLIIERI